MELLVVIAIGAAAVIFLVCRLKRDVEGKDSCGSCPAKKNGCRPAKPKK